ncbi:MAG: hypothetical protein DMG87_01695 [Acidobacteria bacterium]|nr:MAG: hypothetical protein DMG87_01695 [Acidobacteriota bacterium]
MFVLTSGQILLGQLFQFSGRIPRALVARYFLSTRTITSRSGAMAAFKYLAKNSSTRDRVKVHVSTARTYAL